MKSVILDENHVLFDKESLEHYSRNDVTLKQTFSSTLDYIQLKCLALLSPRHMIRSRSICSGGASEEIRAALMGPCQKGSSKPRDSKFNGTNMLMERKRSLKGMTRYYK